MRGKLLLCVSARQTQFLQVFCNFDFHDGDRSFIKSNKRLFWFYDTICGRCAQEPLRGILVEFINGTYNNAQSGTEKSVIGFTA